MSTNNFKSITDGPSNSEIAHRLYSISSKLDFIRAALSDNANHNLAEKVIVLNNDICDIAYYLKGDSDGLECENK